MPDLEAHLQQARHNEGFALGLDRTRFADWAVTAIFYAALHYVDALLATRNEHPGKHDRRDALVAKTLDLMPIGVNYLRLKSRSRNARYSCQRFSPSDVSKAEVSDLHAIKRQVLPKLGPT